MWCFHSFLVSSYISTSSSHSFLSLSFTLSLSIFLSTEYLILQASCLVDENFKGWQIEHNMIHKEDIATVTSQMLDHIVFFFLSWGLKMRMSAVSSKLLVTLTLTKSTPGTKVRSSCFGLHCRCWCTLLPNRFGRLDKLIRMKIIYIIWLYSQTVECQPRRQAWILGRYQEWLP